MRFWCLWGGRCLDTCICKVRHREVPKPVNFFISIVFIRKYITAKSKK